MILGPAPHDRAFLPWKAGRGGAFGFRISDGQASVDRHPPDFGFSVPRNPWRRDETLGRLARQPPHKLTFPQILDCFARFRALSCTPGL